MIKTLIPYNNTEKTAEIMSRYRPIAPKPEVVSSTFPPTDPSQKIRQSTFFRNVWPQLQARPTRTRKRGRAASSSAISPPSPALKRSRNTTPSSCLSLLPHLSLSTINGGGFEDSSSNPSLVTLSLLTPPPPDQTSHGSEINFMKSFDEEKGMEMEMEMERNGVAFNEIIIPEEKDFLQQLQGPISTSNVITPHPVRPVGSTIRVSCINDGQILSPPRAVPKKQPDEVEKEVESDVLPAVISDSNNKVRMANSAYKEMVGQPECAWLDSMVTGNERLKGRRIGGEVMLHLVDVPPPTSSNGFSCWVRIEWGSNEGKKNSISAFCDVIRLSCVSRDYHFIWRFHPQTRKAASII